MRVLVGLLLVWLGLPLASVAALPPDTWLVAIGNNHGAAEDVSLRYAQRDADEVAAVLRRLGGVESTRIRRLVEEEAAAVVQTLNDVEEDVRRARASGKSTAVFVYYSGHADATALHLGASQLPFDRLRELVRSLPADLRVLVVDACRSGGISRVKGVAAGEAFALKLVAELPEGFAVVTSSAAGEDSQESDRLRGSFFSHHLVNALRGAADRNRDGEVTLGEAYDYTYEQTLRSSGSTLQLQHPTYRWELKGRGDVVLTRPVQDTHAGSVRMNEAVTHLFYDADANDLVAEVRPPAAGAHLSLPARRYRIQQRRPRVYLNYVVDLHEGQTLDLAAQPHDAVRYDRLVRKGGGDRALVSGALLMAGARGELVDGEGPAPSVIAGYTAALAWATLEGRLRFSRDRVAAREGRSPRWHNQYALAVTFQRFVDLSWASVAFGVLLEGALHQQRFVGQGAPAERRNGSFSFAALAALERTLWMGTGIRFEFGPVSTLYMGSDVNNGREVAQKLQSRFTWMAAGGVVQRF